LALGVAAFVAASTVNNMNADRLWCERAYPNSPEDLRYCLNQLNQAPAWAIGFGFWFCLGAFFLGTWVSGYIERKR
jgi:hypothetical protein